MEPGDTSYLIDDTKPRPNPLLAMAWAKFERKNNAELRSPEQTGNGKWEVKIPDAKVTLVHDSPNVLLTLAWRAVIEPTR